MKWSHYSKSACPHFFHLLLLTDQWMNLIYGPFFFFNLFHTNYIFQSKKDMQSTNLSEFAAPKLLRFRLKLEKISSNQLPHEISKKLSVYVTEWYARDLWRYWERQLHTLLHWILTYCGQPVDIWRKMRPHTRCFAQWAKNKKVQ